MTERRLSAGAVQQDSYREVGQYVKRVDRFSIVDLFCACESRVSNTSACVISKSSSALLFTTIRLAFAVSSISVSSLEQPRFVDTSHGTFGNYCRAA